MKLYFELHGVIHKKVYTRRNHIVCYIITNRRHLMRMTKYKQILKKL